ncbi:MAG: universal stress protein [Dehalococcoidia bacterium]|nr:universal stress protein [Dehalococcoidia bacterium]
MAIDPLKEITHFLVPVDGTAAAYNALAVVCDMAKRTRAAVSAVHVIEVPRALPVEADLAPEAARGEEILTRAEQIADEHDVQVAGELLQARDAGPALVDEAFDIGAGAIVVGLDYHRRPYGKFEIGRLPEYVLANAHCEVWVIRYAFDEVVDDRGGGRVS